jgi:hypothetical protein
LKNRTNPTTELAEADEENEIAPVKAIFAKNAENKAKALYPKFMPGPLLQGVYAAKTERGLAPVDNAHDTLYSTTAAISKEINASFYSSVPDEMSIDASNMSQAGIKVILMF